MTNKGLAAYLVDTENRERLEFQYNPGELVDTKSTHYVDISVPGISHPRHQYIAGGNRRISFTLFLFKGDVKKRVAWLQSLMYPEHSGTALKSPPHRVVFIFGELYPVITCIVRSVKVRYFNLFDQQTLVPQQAEVDIVLDEFVEESMNRHGDNLNRS
jgi:hypothetical protein